MQTVRRVSPAFWEFGMTLKEFIKDFDLVEEIKPLADSEDETWADIRLRKEHWWFTPEAELSFNDFNKDVVEPNDERYIDEVNWMNGATTIRMDDDFWLCAVLPYEYRDLTIQEIVGILWPTVENPRFNPDAQDIEAWNKIWDDIEHKI